MNVKASVPSVGEVDVRVPSTATVSDLKWRICRSLNIEPGRTSLLLDGKPLEGRLKLRSLDLRSKKIVVDYLWARQLILWGLEGQACLSRSAVLLAGAGAISNEVAKNLAMLGVGKLTIVDNDRVELSNTSRMVFFSKGDIGKPKAIALARGLREKYDVNAEALTCSVEEAPLKEYVNSDLIVSGLDNVISRIYLSEVSRKYLIPLVDGGIIGYHARVQVYIPPDWPCPICPFPSGGYAKLVGLRNPCDAPVEEGKVPSIPTTVSFASSILSHEAVKILLGYKDFKKSGGWPASTGEPMKGILIADLKFSKYSIMELKRNPRCLVCGREGMAKEPIPIIEVRRSSLKNSTTSLKRYVEKHLRIRGADTMLFLRNSGGKHVKIQAGKKLKSYSLGPRDVIQAVFRKGRNEYGEAVIKLI